MADETAERIATLGVSPDRHARARSSPPGRWDDYDIGRAGAIEHLGALDVVYTGVIESHRKAIDVTEEPDPVTQDMLIGQAGQLELFHWFVRAHLESTGGELSTAGATHEKTAAKKAGGAAKRTK